MTIKRFTFIALVAMALASCSTQRTTLTYFDDLKTNPSAEGLALGTTDYEIKIVPDDELVISVTSRVVEASAEYNLPMTNPATGETMLDISQARQQTYVVDAAGDINFPRLGTLHVGGMTTSQVASLIRKKIEGSVEDPHVKVALVNFHVNVIGEVTEPGRKDVNTERYSILDAIAQAGDLTPYGERENVLLIREEDGKRTVHRLNLNDSRLLESPYFYLRQNDVVYVEPNKIRKDNAKYNQNNAYKLSLASAIISGASVIASLVIALTVK